MGRAQGRLNVGLSNAAKLLPKIVSTNQLGVNKITADSSLDFQSQQICRRSDAH